MRRKSWAILVLIILVASTLVGCGSSSTLTILSITEGDVSVMRAGTNSWTEAQVGMSLEAGDSIKTDGNSSAEITFFEGSTIELQANTEIEIASLDISAGTGPTTINLEQVIGTTISRVTKILDPASRYEVATPTGVVAVRGSVMQVYVIEDGTTRAINVEGDIWAIAQGVEVQIPVGRRCVIRGGQPPELEIGDWYDLDAVRDNLDGDYILMNDLDSTTTGYSELAGLTANEGKGWEPIGSGAPFTGSLDGQGHEIGDLFINRPDEDAVGFLRTVDEGAVIKNVGVVNAEVAGRSSVGGLVALYFHGTLVNSYYSGTVTAHDMGGGLVGVIRDGAVSNCYFSGSVSGEWEIGGLVGWNLESTVSNSHYDYGEALINGRHTITIGALSSEDFEQWLANDESLDVDERLSQEDGYYLISDVSDFKQLLAFGQDGSLKFRLLNDLDLGGEPNFYIPYLAGEFDGNGHSISNLNVGFDFGSHVGLFGFLASGAAISQVGVENIGIAGYRGVGGLVGSARGTVNDSYSSGSVSGVESVGGLVGDSWGTVSNSYSSGNVTGDRSIGGLLGEIWRGTVSNSHYDYDEALINSMHIVTIGALSSEDFEQWLAADKVLDIEERLSQENGYYVLNNVSDFKELLAFGQDSSLRFRLNDDLDLSGDPGFYVPYLAGEFDGNGHEISNLDFSFDFVSQVGLFGYLDSAGKVSGVSVRNVDVTGFAYVGGLVGLNMGTVANSHCTGSVGRVAYGWWSGGLVGINGGTVNNSYSSCSVTGVASLGGLTGVNFGTVDNSYATGSVSGDASIGGLVGANDGTVNSSFWDVETSNTEESDGGIGKTTVEMQEVATFTGATWDIIAVANPDARNPSYVWNIADGQTYPFLSWQPVS